MKYWEGVKHFSFFLLQNQALYLWIVTDDYFGFQAHCEVSVRGRVGLQEAGEGLHAILTIPLREGELATEQNAVGFAVLNKDKEVVVSKNLEVILAH